MSLQVALLLILVPRLAWCSGAVMAAAVVVAVAVVLQQHWQRHRPMRESVRRLLIRRMAAQLREVWHKHPQCLQHLQRLQRLQGLQGPQGLQCPQRLQ